MDLSDYERRITTGTMGAFGSYLMQRTFDEAMRTSNLILNGQPAGSDAQALQQRLQGLDPDQRQAAGELARVAVIAALHGLLHGLSHDEERIRLVFDGTDVVCSSDGFHGDLFSWLKHLSKFPYEPPAVSLNLDDPEYDFSSLDDEN